MPEQREPHTLPVAMTSLRRGHLGRKQNMPDDQLWAAAFDRVNENAPWLLRLMDRTIEHIKLRARRERVAYSWSGGKDSIVLEILMREAGVEECVLAISRLEYPEFLQWVTDHMPPGLTVKNMGQDYAWLRAHPRQLFPPTARDAMVWFKGVQHQAQRDFFHEQRLGVLALGRRRAEGNYVGKKKGETEYQDRTGCVRWAPLAHWPHEAVMGVLKKYRVELPPMYRWPRGFQVGTHCWPCRQWTHSIEHGWMEVAAIDPAIVREAARERIPGAAEQLARMAA